MNEKSNFISCPAKHSPESYYSLLSLALQLEFLSSISRGPAELIFKTVSRNSSVVFHPAFCPRINFEADFANRVFFPKGRDIDSD